MKKALLSVFTVILSLVLVVTPSSSWLTDTDEQSNFLQIADMAVEISEEFNQSDNGMIQPGIPYEKVVKIKNTTNAPAFIRVMSFPEMVAGDLANEAFFVFQAAEDIVLDINETDWIDGQDGFYYYKTALPPGETTSALFRTVTVKPEFADSYSGVSFQLVVRSESCGITQDYGHILAWFGGQEPPESPLNMINEMLKGIADEIGGDTE